MIIETKDGSAFRADLIASVTTYVRSLQDVERYGLKPACVSVKLLNNRKAGYEYFDTTFQQTVSVECDSHDLAKTEAERIIHEWRSMTTATDGRTSQ